MELNNICADSIRVVHPLFQEEGGGSTPTSALQLQIGKIDIKLACNLNHLWHSRLPIVISSNIQRTRYNICFAGHFMNKFYAVAIWTSPISASLEYDSLLELRRFAIAPDAPKYTASRMISIMIRDIRKRFPNIKKLISYQDTEVHKGTIYKASGWKSAKKSKFSSWTTNKRIRNCEQSKADKIRWEYDL